MAPKNNSQEYHLKPESELRLELPKGEGASSQVVSVVLTQGTAEVFGVPLAEQRPYHWTFGRNFAIFTWKGCTLVISGLEDNSGAYDSRETPMVSYINTHAQLEALRERASLAAKVSESVHLGAKESTTVPHLPPTTPDLACEGPRVLLVGPPDSGKSSLASILTSYAVRLGRCPLFVDLDVSQSHLSVPGTISVTPVNAHTLSATEDFDHCQPLIFWYGSQSPTHNPALFRAKVQLVSHAVDQRLAGDRMMAASGLIADFGGSIDGEGYELILSTVQQLRIDTILVMGHDRLHHQLSRDRKELRVVKLPRSGGVVNRNDGARSAVQYSRIHSYFYGPPKFGGEGNGVLPPSLSPTQIYVQLDDVYLWRYRGKSQVSSGLLPVTGEFASLDPCALERLDPDSTILHTLVAVLHSPPEDPSTAVNAMVDVGDGEEEEDQEEKEEALAAKLKPMNVAGFVIIQDYSEEDGSMTILTPCGGELPSQHFVLSDDIQWLEQL